jgi:DNA-binding transcriptional regulator YiaG
MLDNAARRTPPSTGAQLTLIGKADMKNTTKRKKLAKRTKARYPSKESRWAYYMQAIEPKSEAINREFPGYHPQWLQLSQKFEISPALFKIMRESLGLSVRQCAAYMRVDPSTIHKWERGEIAVTFIAFELLRIIRESVWFKMKHPSWDGWFVSDQGVLVSPNLRNCQYTPKQLEWFAIQGTEAANLQKEVNRLQRELGEALEENTKLRQMFVAQGVVDELTAMQNTIADLMDRIATAKIIPFQAHNYAKEIAA